MVEVEMGPPAEESPAWFSCVVDPHLLETDEDMRFLSTGWPCCACLGCINHQRMEYDFTRKLYDVYYTGLMRTYMMGRNIPLRLIPADDLYAE